MKIELKNVHEVAKHLEILATLGAVTKYPAAPDKPEPINKYEAVGLYEKLRRIELKAERLMVAQCNGTIDEALAEKQEAKIRESVLELVPALGADFMLNGDPRGYILKIKEARAKELGIHTDMGGYGILAPAF